MEKLQKPYSKKQRADFVCTYKNKHIVEDDNFIYAIEPWEQIINGEVVDNSKEYEAQKAQEEHERIAMLKLTGADVERAIYKVKGIDFDDIIIMLQQIQSSAKSSQPIIDIKALKIELKANKFYRGNEYIDKIGTFLGFTTQQLDSFFEAGTSEDYYTKNNAYKYLTNITLTINTVPENCIVSINNELRTNITLPYGEKVSFIVEKEGFEPYSGTLTLTEDKTLNIELNALEQEEIKF